MINELIDLECAVAPTGASDAVVVAVPIIIIISQES